MFFILIIIAVVLLSFIGFFLILDNFLKYGTGTQRKYLMLFKKTLKESQISPTSNGYSNYNLGRYTFSVDKEYRENFSRYKVSVLDYMTKEEKKVFSDVALSKYHELIRQQEKDKVDQKKEEEIKSKLQQEELYLRKYNELLKLKPLDKDLQETIKKCERKLEIGHQMIKLKEELSRI